MNNTSLVREKLQKKPVIHFTKKETEWLEKRNNSSLTEMKKELYEAKTLVAARRQEIKHKNKMEVRYRCYFLYSRSKGRCYIIKFNNKLKVITVFPLGRQTLRKYKKRFKL